MDIDKATGGAAEAYFRNARGKIAFEIDPEFSSNLIGDPDAKAAFDEAGKRFTNNWQDQITAVGAKVGGRAVGSGVGSRLATGEGSAVGSRVASGISSGQGSPDASAPSPGSAPAPRCALSARWQGS